MIGKIILNLIGKALTSPFSLLASAFGGGGGNEQRGLRPRPRHPQPRGTAKPGQGGQGPDQQPRPQTDRDRHRQPRRGTRGLRRERLQRLVRAEKRRAQPDSNEPVTADEYPALLKAAYGRANIPKPRNLVGIAKDLTVPEMEALLMANQPATEAMATELAAQRGHAIQSYLAAQKLPPRTPLPGRPQNWQPGAQRVHPRQS